MKSLAAGILIGMAGAVYLAIGSTVGALCFSGGLILICMLGYNLYTGKAGLTVTKEVSIKQLFIILILNLIGAYLFGKLFRFYTTNETIIENATRIANIRINNSIIKNLVGGFICGVLIYVGVTAYKNTQNWIALTVCVVFFIIIGAEHSIADMFYFSVSQVKNWYLAEIIIIIGNYLGCIFLPILYQLTKKWQTI